MYEVVLPVGTLAPGVYSVYSRPDVVLRRPGRAAWRAGTRDEIAECALWVGEEEEEGWARVDVSHVLRDRGWEKAPMEVVVANTARFTVV